MHWIVRTLVLAAASTLSACTNLTLAIANAPAVFGDYTVRRDIAYGSLPAQRLDIYVPDAIESSDAKAKPVIIFLHGGGWDSGSKNLYRFVAEAFTSRDYVTVVPAYRLYPETRFPGFVEDAAQAIAWTQAHIHESGGDPKQVFVVGHSAGAHIGAMVAFDESFLRQAQGTPVSGFVGLAGPYDFLPLSSATLQDIFSPSELQPASQPINFVDGTEPRALLIHGLADDVVLPRNSTALANTIRQRGGHVAEQYYDDMSHAGVLAALSVYYRGRRSVLDDVDAFVQEQLNRSTQNGATIAH